MNLSTTVLELQRLSRGKSAIEYLEKDPRGAAITIGKKVVEMLEYFLDDTLQGVLSTGGQYQETIEASHASITNMAIEALYMFSQTDKEALATVIEGTSIEDVDLLNNEEAVIQLRDVDSQIIMKHTQRNEAVTLITLSVAGFETASLCTTTGVSNIAEEQVLIPVDIPGGSCYISAKQFSAHLEKVVTEK